MGFPGRGSTMTDDRIKLTRRKILASAGAVGLAGAGAGLGTSAYFSDTESFENNTLTAGTLDMNVGGETHYYNGIRNLPECDADIRLLGDDDLEDGEVGFPQGDNVDPIVAVPEADVAEFMQCTSELNSEGLTDDPPGLIDLDDVKPGDFGEATLCYSIHSNPGYVELESSLVEDAENTVVEPEEGEDPGDGGELGDAIQAQLWYDAGGNNLLDEGEEIIASGSLNDIVGNSYLLEPAKTGGSDAWEAGDEYCHEPGVDCMETLYLTDTGGGGAGFDDETRLYEVVLDDDENVARLDHLQTTGSGTDFPNFTQTDAIAATPSGDEIFYIDKTSTHLGRYEVASGSFTDLGEISNLSSGDIVLAAFSPEGDLKAVGQNTDTLYTIDIDDTVANSDATLTGVNVSGADIVYGSDGTLYLFSSDDGYLYTVDPEDGEASIVGDSQEDKGSYTGLAIRDSGTGALLGSSEADDAIWTISKDEGNEVTEYEMELDESPYSYGYGDMTVGALCPEFCVALSWWLPLDTGNEVQSDQYAFDLALRTEQCRNNEPEIAE